MIAPTFPTCHPIAAPFVRPISFTDGSTPPPSEFFDRTQDHVGAFMHSRTGWLYSAGKDDFEAPFVSVTGTTTITFAGTGSGGTLTFSAGGVAITPINVGNNSSAQTASALATAINAMSGYPVTASAAGSVVTISFISLVAIITALADDTQTEVVTSGASQARVADFLVTPTGTAQIMPVADPQPGTCGVLRLSGGTALWNQVWQSGVCNFGGDFLLSCKVKFSGLENLQNGILLSPGKYAGFSAGWYIGSGAWYGFAATITQPNWQVILPNPSGSGIEVIDGGWPVTDGCVAEMGTRWG